MAAPRRRVTDLATVPDCGKCGQKHLTKHGHQACVGHCTGIAHPERKGLPCKVAPMTGLRVCGSHGGRAAHARKLSAGVRDEAKALATLQRFGEPIDTTPTEAMLDTVRWTAGYVAWLRSKVAGIRSDKDLVWGKTREKTGGEDWGSTFEAGPNVWVKLLGEWQDRLVKVCSEAIKANVDERRVRVAEQQGELVADVIRRSAEDVLDALIKAGLERNLIPVFQHTLSESVPRRLRLLAGGAA